MELEELDQKLHGLEGKITESKSERKRLLKLIMKGGSDFLEEEMRELDGSVKEMEKDLVTLRSKRENLTRASDNFQKSRDEIATLIDRVQSSSEDSSCLEVLSKTASRTCVRKSKCAMVVTLS